MQPRFNAPSSQYPNRNQSNSTNPPFQSPGFPANPPLPDLCNVLQNPMSLQPQLGPFNPQFPLPFNNPGFSIPNMAALISQQPALMNQLGIALQNHANSMSAAPMFMNQPNPFQLQPQAQTFPVNFPNFPQQQFNQNVALANLMHNLNPVMPQLQNPSQFVGPHPQNPNFFANGPFVGGGQQGNMNQQNGVAGGQQGNMNQQNVAEEKRVNQMPQTQNSRQSVPFGRQGTPVNNVQNGSSTSNTNNFPRKDFRNNMKHQKSQFPHKNNGKRKFGNTNEHKGTGFGHERAAKSGHTDSIEQAGERKRSLTYSEQEIKLWREERKKNHPSNGIKKKHSETIANSEVVNEEAKLRREQLKEILAKQAELGVEVAEIPSHYFSDSEKQVNLRAVNGNTSSKRGKSWNKHGKRGRHNRRDRSSKISPFNRKEQTLLQKLLSADARRDKFHLLQAFRFMVANKFFHDFPEKTLEFPQIIVKEEEARNGAESGKSEHSGKDNPKTSNKRTVENARVMSDAEMEIEACYGEEINRVVQEEEEGEIIN
ncbi:hypothetical protein M5689_022304 [Euphorbia peplus]|nr:hypothetical protein M5689_022304 [Euphorbia peplus]